MIHLARLIALALGGAVLAWQGWNAHNGRFVHRFLVADLVVSLVLIVGSAWPGRRAAAVLLFWGYAALVGVFLSATTAGLLIDGYQRAGTILTTLGLIPCLACSIGLGRWLVTGGRDR